MPAFVLGLEPVNANQFFQVAFEAFKGFLLQVGRSED